MSAANLSRPRLVVTIVVDQLRADYLDRFNDLFLPPGKSRRETGGYRYLRERGAQYPAARYKHFSLFTGPGHAETMGITMQTDRQLAAFFRFLDRSVPGGLQNVTIAITADLGVAPIPERMSALGFRAGRISSRPQLD